MLSLRQLQYRRNRLTKLRTMQELCLLLGKPGHKLELLCAQPMYNEFHIRKRNGGKRHIEDPRPPLKRVLGILNDLLQGVYYFEKTEAAYGFIAIARDDPAPPRHIVTHAERHLGCRWLMNIDLTSFFHQISTEMVLDRLKDPPFHFDDEVADLMARLCTYKGRLPMGAPTSPVLSNLVFQREDEVLKAWADDHGWLYTRYADDLSFSSQKEISSWEMQQTINLLENHSYAVHPEKRRLYGPDDVKNVTRLVLGDGELELPPDFLEELRDCIEDLRRTTRTHLRMGVARPPAWLTKYRQRLNGMMGFAKHVLGEYDEDFLQIQRSYDEAVNPPDEDFGTYSWLDFPYW
ncbi:MAG TPA: RNA-directed DNA polymerase [Bacteroidetes bacterium]|nr:RNA-directed DNA polymerase [Bacteroidota bacterium]